VLLKMFKTCRHFLPMLTLILQYDVKNDAPLSRKIQCRRERGARRHAMSAELTTAPKAAVETATDGNSVNEALKQLMMRHAPTMVFAPDEQYFSDRVPAYLDVVELRDARDGRLIAGPPLTPGNLPSGQPSANTYLHIPSSSEKIKFGNFDRTEIYVHA